jgi:hypothetical protein
MLQLVLYLYGFCHATQLAYRMAGVKYGVRRRGKEVEIRNTGTDGMGWTERVACWQTVNWPEQKIVWELRGECRVGTRYAWEHNIKMDRNK